MGTLVADRYELLEIIGEGGVSVVYRAIDTRLNKIVALKILREQYVTDPTFVTRFRNEAQAIASLNHPNIVTVCDYGKTAATGFARAGSYYITMNYVDGPSLHTAIRRQGRLGIGAAVGIASQVLSGLGAAHAQGIIHRDVKPQNILLTRDHVALVTDFGIAKILTTPTLTDQGMTIGTAAYIAPEQAQGLAVGPPADLYGVGIVLYEMLTGSPPFGGASALEVAMKQVSQPPRPPHELNPAIPVSLEAMILRALAKQPDRRYQSAGEMIAALAAFQAEPEHTITEQPAPAVTTPLPVVPDTAELTQALPITGPPPVVRLPRPVPPATGSGEEAPPSPGLHVKQQRGLIALLLLGALLAGIVFFAGRFSDRNGNAGRATPPSATVIVTRPGAVAEAGGSPTVTQSPVAVVVPPTATPTMLPTWAPGLVPVVAPTETPPPPTATLRPQPAYVVQAVNLRAGPDISAPIMTGLPVNTQVTIIGSSDGWSKIDVDGTTLEGWSITGALAPGFVPTATPTPLPPAPSPTPLPPAPANTPSGVPGGQITLQASDFSGGYHNNPFTQPYQGRIAIWIYGAGTPYSSMEAAFTLQTPPSPGAPVTLVVDGQDSEDSTKTPIQILVNGVVIYAGADALPNANSSPTGNWGRASYPIPATLLHPGRNTLTFKNVANDSRVGGPYNWMMIDSVLITW